MAEQEDCYQILGVGPEATLEEIRHAYRAKARDYHPDLLARVSDAVRRLAEEKLKEINAAYEVLGDPGKRKQYDAETLRKNNRPKPEVTPPAIIFNYVAPGRKQTGSFVLQLHLALIFLLLSAAGTVAFGAGLFIFWLEVRNAGSAEVPLWPNWLVISMLVSPVFLALAENRWDFDKNNPPDNPDWFALVWLFIAPIAGIISLYLIFIRYPISLLSVKRRP